MDSLADILAALELRSNSCYRAEFSAPFAVFVPEAKRHIRLYVAGPGRSWVGLPSGESTFYSEGDLVLVPHGEAHVLASDPRCRPQPLEDVLTSASFSEGGLVRCGGGGKRARVTCCDLELDELVVHPVVETLPPLLHLGGQRGRSHAWLGSLLEYAETEQRLGRPACWEVVKRLSEVVFIYVLRAYLEASEDAPTVPELIADPHLARALSAIHADPGADWSLEKLAAIAGISRTLFAQRFRERVATTPMRHVAGLRMQKARTLLAREALSVGEVARRVGYASEAAFNRVFRASFGEAPGRFRRTLMAEVATQLDDPAIRGSDGRHPLQRTGPQDGVAPVRRLGHPA